jgi:hypothetical protein
MKVFVWIFGFAILMGIFLDYSKEVYLCMFGIAIIIFTNGVDGSRKLDKAGLLVGGTMIFCAIFLS